MSEETIIRTAVVTGGSRGIGRAVCIQLAKQGCNVVVNYCHGEAAAAETVALCKAENANAVAVQADVSTAEGCKALFEQAVNAFGRVDILVNNTYGFSHGLGILIMGIGILTFLGIFSPKTGLVGAGLAIVMTLGTLSFLVTTPEVWVPDLGSGEQGFPLLTGAGRLVIKDIAILAGAVVVLSDSAGRVLNQLKK